MCIVNLQKAILTYSTLIEAEKWYAKALETSSEPEMVYNYSQMLKANGKYEESNTAA